MLFATVFYFNSLGNFVLGVALSALLGPAEFGRYATVALAAITLATAVLDWLRFSALRFSGEARGRIRIASSLEAAYLGVIVLLALGLGVLLLGGWTLGLTPGLLVLTPMLAIALNRVDFAGALFRSRDQERDFAALYSLRQVFYFTLVVGTAYFTRNSAMTIGALALASLIPALALGGSLRTPGAALKRASPKSLMQFLLYAKPIVASLVIYQLISLINRHAALDHLGAVATGKLSLASDLGQRLYLSVNSLPELLLFQYVLRRDREEGRAAAEQQIGVNIVTVFALIAALTAGYMAMAPTFEALLVPQAYRGDYARLTMELAPGFLALCMISSALNPVFQLAERTWPVTIAAIGALLTDFALLQFGDATQSVEGLARANSISLGAGFLIAGVIAFSQSAVRPRLTDIAVVVAASLALRCGLPPLNYLNSHVLAAALALVLGGGFYGGILLLFNVAGLRSALLARLQASHSKAEATAATDLKPTPAPSTSSDATLA